MSMSNEMKLEDRFDHLGKAMQAAWSRVKKVQTRMWSDWMAIGEGLMEGRNWAMRVAGVNTPQGRGYVVAYAEWLMRYKVNDMDKSVRAKLLKIMEERAAVEEWRQTLPQSDRMKVNNPDVTWRRFVAATKVAVPKPRSKEAGRAQAEIDQGRERIEELEQELAGLRDEPRVDTVRRLLAEMSNEEWTALRDAEDKRRAPEKVRIKPKGRRTPDDLRAELDARKTNGPEA